MSNHQVSGWIVGGIKEKRFIDFSHRICNADIDGYSHTFFYDNTSDTIYDFTLGKMGIPNKVYETNYKIDDFVAHQPFIPGNIAYTRNQLLNDYTYSRLESCLNMFGCNIKNGHLLNPHTDDTNKYNMGFFYDKPTNNIYQWDYINSADDKNFSRSHYALSDFVDYQKFNAPTSAMFKHMMQLFERQYGESRYHCEYIDLNKNDERKNDNTFYYWHIIKDNVYAFTDGISSKWSSMGIGINSVINGAASGSLK